MKQRHTVLASLIALSIMLLATSAGAEGYAPVMPERVVLENGLTVILAPIAGSGQVTVTSMYRAGLIDEPEGMPMVSYLTARVVCNGATRSYKAGEALELLFKDGIAGGETMQSATHCDYVVPSDGLEAALKIEGERLTSLQITQDIVDSQLSLCYDETAYMDQVPMAGQYKAACAALGQAWRYGATDVTVKSGLENAPLSKIQEYYGSHFQPTGAVVVLAGDFDRAKAIDLTEEYLGCIPPQEMAPVQPIEWQALPDKIEVKWDSGIRALCIGFRPTDSLLDQYLLQTLGRLLSVSLAEDDRIAKLADCVLCADPMQTFDRLPFFIYATPKRGVSVDALRKALRIALQEELASPEIEDAVAQAIAMAQQVGKTCVPSHDELVAAIQQMLPESDPKDWVGLMIGQIALQFGFEEMITGCNPDYLSITDDTTPDAVLARFKSMLDPSREFVTVLNPMRKSR